MSHHIREFPWQRRVRPGYELKVPLIADGSPPHGLYVESFGFDTFLYRTEPLTVVSFEKILDAHAALGPIVGEPRAFRLADVKKSIFPQMIVRSDDMSLSVLHTERLAGNIFCPRYGLRNADRNEVFFVYSGSGTIFTDMGTLSYAPGNFFFIPAGMTYAVADDGGPASTLFVIAEIPKPLYKPHHYWFSDFFPYDPSAIIPADPTPVETDEDLVIYEKVGGAYYAKLTYPFSPFNCVGWQGKRYPFGLALEYIHTVVSPTFHVPPTSLITFTTEDCDAMISTFKPRWMHSLPYHHRNDHHEFCFYHMGEYSARTGIRLGDGTLHPAGAHHGPQPNRLKAWERVAPKNLPWREEVAIMFESRSPFTLGILGEAATIQGYETSWLDEWEELQKEA